MRFRQFAILLSISILPLAVSQTSFAQTVRIGPGGVELRPEGRRPPPAVVRDELAVRMIELRDLCEAGDRKACVRMGIIIGENAGRREAWRHEHPEVFFYER